MRIQFGYVANPAGPSFIDLGVGAFLAGTGPSPDPNATQWAPLAPKFNGKFQVPTLRNVDKRPRPDFVKAYMHNGYLKSLKPGDPPRGHKGLEPWRRGVFEGELLVMERHGVDQALAE